MSETKFTKGPWHYDSVEDGSVLNADGDQVGWGCRMVDVPLIAAAPELYEALSELVRMNERWNADVREIIGRPPSWTDQYLTTARLALKKARGEQ